MRALRQGRRKTSGRFEDYELTHASRPETTRSLPNGYIELGHEHLASHPLLNLFGGSALKEQLQRLAKVLSGSLNGVSLAGHVQFWT